MNPTSDPVRERLRKLGLYGLLAQGDGLFQEPWLPRLLDLEESERGRRSLERRLRQARLGPFKPMTDFDWTWPRKLDREAVEDLFTLGFLEDAANVVFVGPNGTGKTMIAQNLAYQAILRGCTARLTTAADMLSELNDRTTDRSLARRLRRFCHPTILVIDEVGYLSYDARYADLLFEVITRRYQHQPTILTTNKPFAEWNDVFPNAACTVTLIDRLVHRAEIIPIDGDSYRLKEAKERAARKSQERAARRKTRKA